MPNHVLLKVFGSCVTLTWNTDVADLGALAETIGSRKGVEDVDVSRYSMAVNLASHVITTAQFAQDLIKDAAADTGTRLGKLLQAAFGADVTVAYDLTNSHWHVGQSITIGGGYAQGNTITTGGPYYQTYTTGGGSATGGAAGGSGSP